MKHLSTPVVRRFVALLAIALTGITATAAARAPAAHAEAPPVIANDYSDDVVWEQNVSTEDIYLRFRRTGDLSFASSAKLTITDGTAVRGSDYTAATYVTTVRFPADASYAYFAIKIKGDVAVEPDETFGWRLSDPVNATITDGTGTVTILNDDSAAPPTFSIADAYYAAESPGGSTAQFTVTRSGSTAASATVKFATVNGTAVAPGDYTAKTPTSLFFAVGQTMKDVLIPIKDDLVPEPTETFSVQLSAPVRATIADGTGVATVHDDDSTAQPALSVWDGWTAEGDTYSHPMTITVHRDGNLQGTSTVSYATADGTAKAPSHYVSKTGTLTFRPGETDKTFTVTIKGDKYVDTDFEKYFWVVLSNASPGTIIVDTYGQMTIEDDDYY